ncbi:DUF4426 domain-containing protein [Biformimicrobium ophioploci]|uniref:DUF4426 domain-containing protein n=1 Tax=Biformimicrobium ophioploci TaxID=3036711 RepID=A0ABQ6LV19_9GAMM|nr:DUF4426 domain-containing protein [Microbulbifer sp. NKW57]GMG85928.1 DUF4426 domain-containing protein [Microbulbifer sp. NKW57]
MKTLIHKTFFLACAFMLAFSANAQQAKEIDTHKDFGDYRVIFSVFNSDFLTPEIASNYNLVRAKDRVYVNVAVVKKGEAKGLPAKISGQASNLMQQRRPLEFIEVREKDAVYYLAPLRYNDEETLTFRIEVELPNGEVAQVDFRRKLDK